MKIDFDEAMLENSFKDYHVKGFDYLCLKRSPELTQKVYFFDGIAEELPEVVCPHDHRYSFTTRVLAGSVMNFKYSPHDDGEVMQRFHYRTPLNGGNGFTWMAEQRLKMFSWNGYLAGATPYRMGFEEIHTIRTTATTVLFLQQYADVPVQHTTTWTRDKEPINLSGMYNRFTADEIIARLKQLESLL